MLKKAAIFVGFLFSVYMLNGQEQRIADSLLKEYESIALYDTNGLELLRQIAFNECEDFDRSIKYSNKLIDLAKTLDNHIYLHRGYFQKGNKLRLKGELESAIEAYFEAAIAASIVNYTVGIGSAYTCLGDIYSVSGNHNNSIHYYNKAIAILQETTDSITLATAYLNAGDEYLNVNILDSALMYFEESAIIFNATHYQAGIAYNYGNMGLVYAKQGKHVLAEEYINKATHILQERGDRYPIAVYDTYMADIYLEKGDWQRAIKYAQHSLQIAQEDGLKAQVRDASGKLADLYEGVQDYKKAYFYQKQYLAYRDSVSNEKDIQRMADLRTEFEVSQKQAEVDLLDEQRRNQQVVLWALAFILMLVGGLVFVLFRNAKQKSRTNLLLSEKNTEIESQRDELQVTNKKLLELDQFKQGMTSMIVHDLKNPLNGIINQSGDEKVKHSGKLMLNMVLNILDVDKYENTKMTIDQTACSLFEVSQKAISEVLFLAKQKNIQINNRMLPEYGVYVDFDLVERVFVNILTNAIKYTPINGKVSLMGEDLQGTNDTAQSEFLKISIADSGQGIPKDKQHLLFQKFGQVMAKNSGGVRSTGLGLAFCKLAIEAHGGQIGVDCIAHEGSVFWFTLPKGKNISVNLPVSTDGLKTEEDNDLLLTEADRQYLHPYVERLKMWEVFDVSELEAIVAEIAVSGSEGIVQWKAKLENAIYLCNQELFQECLAFVE